MSAPSDESLLAGLSSKDPEAAAAFVRRFQNRVFGLALAMIGDRQEAEEVAQETFVRAWRNAESFDPRKGRVATWLLTIARNLAIDARRVRRPEPVETGFTEEAMFVIPDRDPEDHGEIVDDIRRLRVALGRISEEQRRALLLAALCGRTGREIAEAEDVPVGTVKTRIRNAMLKLREALEVGHER